jgi:hypothetical protein
MYGHVELLRWLVDNGCPWEAQYMCSASATSSSVEVLKYLQELGLLTCAPLLTWMLNMAACYSKVAAAKWFKEQGADWPYMHVLHVPGWSHDVLTWARADGFTVATR